MPDRKVVDIMTRDLTALTPETSLQQAAHLFSLMRISGLPVVDEQQRVIGFLSEADIIDAISPRSRDHSGIFLMDFGEIARKMRSASNAVVRDYMTEHPITVEESQDIGSVSEIMLTEHTKILPVVRDGVLIGIVNRADACSALMEDHWES
ncbi:MAG: CBS domain-containing protein [Coriobacteriia bacterium]|nr:CBS domain-containing protein [Coriobacteriia bacterium]MDZ4655156.1 CBS domain-containing protein [Coriobacteriia bacterium]